MKKEIDFQFITNKLSTGLKLRFDIGLSSNMPNTINWLESNSDVFVISIEPHPNNFLACQNYMNSSSMRDRCYLIEAAVDDVDEPTQKVFYGLGGPATGYDPGTSSLRKPKGRFADSIDDVYNVDVIPLHYILDNIDYDYIDLLKTDTQGNDLNVLKSLRDHLTRVYDVYAEYDESNDYENGNTGEELDQFLFENNFEKYESIVAPSRNNKVEDCRYKNINKFYPYINGKKIIIGKQSVEQNRHTWQENNVFEFELIEKFASYIKDDFTILDVGAQSGCFSLLAKFYPNTKWHSFEPDPLNFNLLIDNLHLNSVRNVITYNQALSDNSNMNILKVCNDHRGLNTLGKNLLRFTEQESSDVNIQTNKIDNLFLDTKIDLIKIDTEGSEYDIITGAMKTIEKYKPIIFLEYYDENLRQCGKTLEDLNNLIEKINYEIICNHKYPSNVIIKHKD